MTDMPELSRPMRLDTLGTAPRTVTIDTTPPEREALARRFALVALDSLSATASLIRAGDTVTCTGNLFAEVTQECVASGEPVPATIDEPFTILFQPQPAEAEDEVEIGEGELDVVFYDGASIDVGEAVAETLSLALPPYPRAAGADAVLREAGVKSEEDELEERLSRSPFAALKKP